MDTMSNLSSRPQCKNFAERAAKVNREARTIRRDNYYNNPKICINPSCDIVIEYEYKRVKKYCSRSCSAKINNIGRKHSIETKRKIGNAISLTRKKFRTNKVWFRDCLSCNILFTARKYNHTYCDNCREIFLKNYREKARFNFNKIEFPQLYDEVLIKKHGWFHNENQNGVVFDHLYRVVDGFINKIPSEIISHPANAELITMHENRRRQKQSSISLDELYERIGRWGEF